MKFYNIKCPDNQVSFSHALIYGLGQEQGLFFPVALPVFSNFEIDYLLDMDFITRSVYILSIFIGNEMSQEQILKCVRSAFTFPVPLCFINDNIAILELFHGPTLAFKDFGARLMAKILIEINQKNSMTVLTATSGDTGAAVAHAFYDIENIRVVILYPKGKIPTLQKKLFCTLGKNIHTLAVDGDFDLCQLLVKQAFNDDILRKKLCLNSANSMNICRLLAQMCYFFEAIAQVPYSMRKNVVISVPSGNFGNLTSGLLAKSLGLPVKKFIAATNVNDTVPRFLDNGIWDPHDTISTLSNAMDVSQPNNWDRIMMLFRCKHWKLSDLFCRSVDDLETRKAICNILNCGYLSEPHAATAYYLLRKQIEANDIGLFLGTAHPAKFKYILEDIIGKDVLSILLPKGLRDSMVLPSLSVQIPPDFNILYEMLIAL